MIIHEICSDNMKILIKAGVLPAGLPAWNSMFSQSQAAFIRFTSLALKLHQTFESSVQRGLEATSLWPEILKCELLNLWIMTNILKTNTSLKISKCCLHKNGKCCFVSLSFQMFYVRIESHCKSD